MSAPRIILASASPQRRALLTQIGASFEVEVSGAQELTAGPPEEVVLENAFRKAATVAQRIGAEGQADGSVVLGVDTIVALGPRIYGKPADRAGARTTLRKLAGRSHVVLSGVCVMPAGGPRTAARTAAARTTVRFRALDDAEIEAYLDTGEWRERAGGYAIQERGALLVAGIDGDYANVVGLPLSTLAELVPGLL